MCGGGENSYGKDDNDDGKVSFGESIRDMFDGGGRGASGDTFEGGISSISNAMGATPRGSDRKATGLAGALTGGRDDSGKRSNVNAALRGALMGGIPGMVAGFATNQLTGGKGLRSLFGETEEAPAAAKPAAPEGPMRPKMRPANLGAPAVDPFASDSARPAPTVQLAPPAAPTVELPNMSEAAAQGAFQAIPNPNYDPTDPMSPRFLSNPTYDQLLAFRDTGQVPGMAGGGFMEFLESFKGDPYERGERMQQRIREKEDKKDDEDSTLQIYLGKLRNAVGMAEGGEVMGGNEKTMIADAVSAVKGEMSEEQAALVLGKFLGSYGEDALRDLVDKVQSGELDDTVERFAAGEAGAVRGPGDGSGVDDKVPATLEGQQDVLLADGEFVLRKKTADALEKKYGGGFLDAVNEAETDAPRTMREYMAKKA